MNDDCGDDCQAALRSLQRYLDGELPDTRLETIGRHLAACLPCGDRVAFEAEFRRVIRRGCDDRAPRELVERVRVRLDRVAIELREPGAG